MGRFHDVSIYWGTRLLTTSTRLEVAVRSPYLHQLLTSITVCDGCKDPISLIFPAGDETPNTLQVVFKSLIARAGQSRYSIVESPQSVAALRVRLGEIGGGGGSDSTRELGQGYQLARNVESLPDPVPSLSGQSFQGVIRNTEMVGKNSDKDEAGPSDTVVPASNGEEGGGEGYIADTSQVQEDGGEGSDSQFSAEPTKPRDKFSCGLCDHKPFPSRSYLYVHYSISHFWRSLKQFIKGKKCHICGLERQKMSNLVCHVGLTHGKVDEFLDPSLRLPKGMGGRRPIQSLPQTSKIPKQTNNKRSLYQLDLDLELSRDKDPAEPETIQGVVVGDGEAGESQLNKEDRSVDNLNDEEEKKEDEQKGYECYLCQKRFSPRCLLERHLAQFHFEEELMQFIDEDQLLCKICESKFSNIHNLRAHVGIAHRKVDEVMQQKTKTPQQTGKKQSFDQLYLDLELSSDEDSMENNEEENEVKDLKEKNSRKRLRVSWEDDQDYSKAKKMISNMIPI